MSDFEINRRVLAIKSGLKPLGYAHDADGRSTGFFDVSGHYHWYDFCNSWADAGPIIQQNNISLLKCERMDEWVAGSSYWVDGAEWSVDWLSDDKSPLRAAMIVYLMMHDKGEG